jgi:hypothetical protein
MSIRFAPLAAICGGLVFISASAQIAPSQVDPEAIYNFDPSGGRGVPLTCETVRAYLSKSIPKPSQGPEQLQVARNRRNEAKAAKTAMLADPTIYAPRWEEQAFELQDGSVRPMTEFEKATLAELDALDADSRSYSAQYSLSFATETVRHAYADALCGLMQNGIRFAGLDYVGYRRIDSDWKNFGGWRDSPDGRTLIELPVTQEALIALLRYEVAHQQVELIRAERNAVRMVVTPTAGSSKPF